ncbi:MAG: hypothetical protein OEW26_07100 [Nitrospirota bacterium]|jgi:hypothetical protein|nr:hypothetical protein [Nitrospirota bacterium]
MRTPNSTHASDDIVLKVGACVEGKSGVEAVREERSLKGCVGLRQIC